MNSYDLRHRAKRMCATPSVAALALWVALVSPAQAQITQIIDSTGDGTNGLSSARGVATDGAGNVFVAGRSSHNAFRITPGGTITEIINSLGDGLYGLNSPTGLAADDSGNVFVAGDLSHNAFQITPGGTITRIIDSSGDLLNMLFRPFGVAVDGSGDVFVAGIGLSNAFRITPDVIPDLVTRIQIIDSTGDGLNVLDTPLDVATDGSGNVFVPGSSSDNAFRITPDGAITQIIDSTGDGTNPLEGTARVATDGSGNVLVAGAFSNNVFRITPDGTITQIIDSTGDGTNGFAEAAGIATDSAGRVFVAGASSHNVFRITPGGTITQIIDSTGDGINGLSFPRYVTTDSAGRVFVSGSDSSNVFKIEPVSAGCPASPDPGCTTGFEKGVLVVNEKKAGKEKIVVKLTKGPAIIPSDLGDPTIAIGSEFATCIYDDADALVAELVVDRAGDLCGTKPCWRSLGDDPPTGKGFLFKDSAQASDGVKSLLLRGGDAGKSKSILLAGNNAAKGQLELPTGIPAALLATGSVQVQVHGNDASACYAKTLTEIVKQEADLFKAK